MLDQIGSFIAQALGAIAAPAITEDKFTQAFDFNQGSQSPANLYWPSMNFISPLSGYVDAHYPDINSAPYSGGARSQALNQTVPFMQWWSNLARAFGARSDALTQTLPYLPWRGLVGSDKSDLAGNNFGGDDNGSYFYVNNPYQGLRQPQTESLASFSRITMP